MTSLKSRLLISSICLLLLSIVIIGYQLEKGFIDRADSHVKIYLESQVYDLQRSANLDAKGKLILPEKVKDRHLNKKDSGYYASVSHNNEIIWRSKSSVGLNIPFKTDLKPGQRLFSKVTTESGEQLFLFSLGYVWIGDDGNPTLFVFNVAESDKNYTKELTAYRHTLWLWLFIILVVFSLVQTLILRWGLKPLIKLRSDLSEIEQGTREFLDINFIDEIKDLTADFNTLLRSERARQEKYKHSLGDLAHSFKTPLAVIQSSINQEGVEAKLKSTIQDQVDSLNNQVTYQLRKAQAAGSRASITKPVAIEPIFKKITSALLKVHQRKNVKLNFEIEPDSVFYGDEGDIFEVMGNLLDNAFKWCKLTVNFKASNKRLDDAIVLEIIVEDDGPGIEEKAKQLILKRGVRADEKTPGHGIGMSIVSDIMSSYFGEIEVHDSELGGAKFIIKFKY